MRAFLPPITVILAVIAFPLSGCVDRSDPTDPGAPTTVTILSVAVEVPVASLEVGGSTSAVATQVNADGEVSSAQVTWLSSDNSVLSVGGGGQVSARKMGTAWLYATNQGVAGRISITVTDSAPTVLHLSPRSATAPVGTQLQLSTTIATATGRAVSAHPVVWTSLDTRYATVSSTGLVSGVAAGTARITALASHAADTAVVTIINAPPPPVDLPAGAGHEPTAMTLVQDWDGHSVGAWRSDNTPTAPFVWDASLQNTVMQLQYGPVVVAARSTYGPGHLYFPIRAPAPLHSVYIRAQLKLSANWIQNPSGVLKVFEVFSGRTWAIPGIYGTGSNLRLMVANDEREDPSYPGCFIGQVAPSCKAVARPPSIFTLDSWHTIEVLLVSNSPGVSNGRVKTWLDGRPQTDVSDVMWATRNTPNAFTQFDLNPLWGGLGGTISAPQWLSVGQIHLSGSTQYLTGVVP